jgi:hypothetical protein
MTKPGIARSTLGGLLLARGTGDEANITPPAHGVDQKLAELLSGRTNIQREAKMGCGPLQPLKMVLQPTKRRHRLLEFGLVAHKVHRM